MKKTLVLTIALTAMFLVSANGVFAQDGSADNHSLTVVMPTVALLDIEDDASNSITMTFIAPTEAGDSIQLPDENTSLWLNYSSIVGGTLAAPVLRKVVVKSSAVIDGLDLKVAAAAATSDGGGSKGTPAGTVTLTTSDQDFVTSVGSCWTGNGTTKGHKLSYSLSTIGSTDYADLRTGSTALTITYTFVAN
jgi:hypothetical protein